MTIVYKKIEFEKENEEERIRMINRCAAINRWRDGVNGRVRIISIDSFDDSVGIWYEV